MKTKRLTRTKKYNILFYSFLSLLVICLLYLLLLNKATRYCPLKHKLKDFMSCKIISKSDGRILIEHYDYDDNILTLSIYENGKNTFIEHPLKNSNRRFSATDSVKFDIVNKNIIMIGKRKLLIKKTNLN